MSVDTVQTKPHAHTHAHAHAHAHAHTHTHTHSLRHWEFLQLQWRLFPWTDAFAAATTWASMTAREEEEEDGRERELQKASEKKKGVKQSLNIQ